MSLMKMSIRHRALAGVLAGAAVLLAGCAMPGSEGAPGTAAAFEGRVISNERVTTLQDVWRDEAGSSASRNNVVTLELMREPLIVATDQIGFDYHRSQARQQAQLVMRVQGVDAEPSEDLVDAMESAFLLAAFTLLPEDTSVLESVAQQVEEEAAVSPRSGEFSAAVFLTSAQSAMDAATAEANQGSPVWVVSFSSVTGMVPPDAPWLASE